MRRKREAVLTFEWNNDHLPKIVRQERQKYKNLSRILDDHPVILDVVHEDLKTLSQDSGSGQRVREGDFTSETILRTLIVHAVEGLSLRDTVIRVAESDFLQDFITDYEVYEKQQADSNLTRTVIERHEKLFGETPEVLAADKGFCPNAEEYAKLEKQVGTPAIPKRLRDMADALISAWQAFRAGIEGTISGLKQETMAYHGKVDWRYRP